MLDLLGDLLTSSVSTSATLPKGRGRWLSCLLLFLVCGLGGGALALYVWLETLEVTR